MWVLWIMTFILLKCCAVPHISLWYSNSDFMHSEENFKVGGPHIGYHSS